LIAIQKVKDFMDKLPLNKTPINFRAFPVNDILPTGTVTFLFTDIQDSTPLWESQPEKMAEAMHIHNTVLKHVIQAYEGVIFQTVGDAFCASFPTAFQALNAAVDGQRHLQEARWNELGELKVRMGLHTGEEALDPSGDGYILSHNKNRVARIMSAAYGGQVLLSQETKEFVERQLPEGILLKDLGELRLKGMVRLEHLFQVSAPGLLSDFPPLTTTVQHPHNLPVRLTSFVGRQADVEAVCQLLLNESVRLLTITGVGGTGKTSLALQVGWKLLESFRDGIFFIDLVPINDSSLVLSAIASTLNLHQLPGKPLKVVLAEHLLSRRLLLILDNFEQVLPAGMELVDLMKSAPQVKFIVTSRERLRVSPENQYFLSPFPLPSPDCTLETLRESEAVQLFIDRAQVIQPDLRLTMENGAEIAEICRRLDGLPLAIELIDARLSLFNVPELSKQLSNRLRLLSGGWRDIPSRHHTMRAAIAWSCELLDEEEKNLFYRLAVFPGSFDLEEVEAICGAKGLDIFSGMASLMDKHLVNRQEVDGQPRFW
jgi:predicted ATPase/class 3 adenylate cyclase